MMKFIFAIAFLCCGSFARAQAISGSCSAEYQATTIIKNALNNLNAPVAGEVQKPAVDEPREDDYLRAIFTGEYVFSVAQYSRCLDAQASKPATINCSSQKLLVQKASDAVEAQGVDDPADYNATSIFLDVNMQSAADAYLSCLNN